MFFEFSSCVLEFNKIYDKENNIERAEAITCVPLSDEQITNLREKIEKIISKKVHITNKVDESIIGGVILKLNNKMYDGSIRKSLNEIACKIKSNTL
jgi:ATP synthase F1 delta subunit